jgi:hypothetical protein
MASRIEPLSTGRQEISDNAVARVPISVDQNPGAPFCCLHFKLMIEYNQAFVSLLCIFFVKYMQTHLPKEILLLLGRITSKAS